MLVDKTTKCVYFDAYDVYTLLYYLCEFRLGDGRYLTRTQIERELCKKMREIDKKISEGNLDEVN